MLYICTWLWGVKWEPKYVDKLFSGIDRHLSLEHKNVLITDRLLPSHTGYQQWENGADIVYGIDQEDMPYLNFPGCLVRMRMFDVMWQHKIGMQVGDRVVNVDVDAVPTGPLNSLFDRWDEFTIMQGFNSTNPCPFNGSLWMFRAGERHDVWNDFSLDAHKKFNVPIHAIADDQGWLHYKFPDAKAYGPSDGVYAFKKRTWPTPDLTLPKDAKLVAFPGRSPEKYQNLPWVKEHWR